MKLKDRDTPPGRRQVVPAANESAGVAEHAVAGGGGIPQTARPATGQPQPEPGDDIMDKKTDALDDFLGGLPDLRVAPPKPRPLPQEEKVRRLAGAVLARLHRDGACRVGDLEADAPRLGVTGRLDLTLGGGVAGKGGMNLFLDGGQVVPCQNNAKVCIDRLGRERLSEWLAGNGLSVGQLEAWFKRQPAV